MCCNVDQAVFFQHEGCNLIIILVHVDDCTIAATTITLILNFKKKISEHVEITDLGELHWLLGIEIRCDREHHSIHLSQRSYIDSIIRHYKLQDLKPVSTPHGNQPSSFLIPIPLNHCQIRSDV
jgi:Reverse transcriptase (RNA-dependent DNA polymerase)